MLFLQKIGKSLMLPIASLPVAALLLRFGVLLDKDLANHLPQFLIVVGQVIQVAGGALFDNIGIIFAVGIAIGFSKDQHGSSALAALIGYLVMFAVIGAVYKVANPASLANKNLDKITDLVEYKAALAKQINGYNIGDLNFKGFGGQTILPAIVIGVVAGSTYNKFKDVKLHQSLSFFGGKRLVPLLTSIFAIFIGVIFAYITPYLQHGIEALTSYINSTKSIGYFLYGFLNRLLIPTGLHHVLNSFFWFVSGKCLDPGKDALTGDINLFLNACKQVTSSTATPGTFQTGFFPIMMFGLPGAALAMVKTAKKENRKNVLGVMGGIAAVSFLTGVTEPIEFSFMFASPVLFALHAILTGLSHVLTNLLHVYHGFGFSAGLLDYILNFTIAKNPLYILIIGAFMFPAYYFSFSFIIQKWNIKTPGREEDEFENKDNDSTIKTTTSDKIQVIFDAIGGSSNIVEVNNCTTRLRLVLKDTSIVDQKAIKSTGAMGQVKVSDTQYQIIIGPEVEFWADDLKKLL